MRLAYVCGLYFLVSWAAFRFDTPITWVGAWLLQAFILCGLLSVVHECAHKVFVRGAARGNTVLILPH